MSLHFIKAPAPVDLKLMNYRAYYLLGEHIEDIKVVAFAGSNSIPAKNITCRSDRIYFDSPFLRTTNVQTEGNYFVSCQAEYSGDKSQEFTFSLYFLSRSYVL